MDILVFSDSHHDTTGMALAVRKENPDMVIHLGDNVHDALTLKQLFPKIKIEMVSGNCDFESMESEKKIEVENTKFFLTHGHTYHVKSGIRKIIKKGLEEKADITLFGHTHKPHIHTENGGWIINPGSICNIYKGGKNPSYAKITIEDGKADCTIAEII